MTVCQAFWPRRGVAWRNVSTTLIQPGSVFRLVFPDVCRGAARRVGFFRLSGCPWLMEDGKPSVGGPRSHGSPHSRFTEHSRCLAGHL